VKIRLDRDLEESLLTQARDQIVSALHAGVVRRGDRLPSLRRVATVSHLNVKTVLKIYGQLRKEGLVELRRGSGAFVTAIDSGEFEPEQAMRLSRFLRRHLDEASGMSITPGDYAALLQKWITRSALKRESVAVLECNEEQVHLFAREIEARIGVKASPVLLGEIGGSRGRSVIRGCSIVAVTDFHIKEGTEIAKKHGKPVIRLRMRGDFVPALIEAGRGGRLVMIVSNTAFIPAFKRALGLLGLQRDGLDRISAVEGSNRAAVSRALARADAAYLSPLCDRSLLGLVPREARLLNFDDHLDAESLEELEAWLLLASSGPAPNGHPSK
jgi:GntR family transcriptional regulator